MTRTKRRKASITRCAISKDRKYKRRRLNKKKKSKQHNGKDCWICW